MSVREIAKRLDLRHNVSIRVLDDSTGAVVSEHTGHNASTNSLLTGIAHYLTGDGVLGQSEVLENWVPQYISLGTMGLINQEEDEHGYPAGIGNVDGPELQRYAEYMQQCPGFGADGYDANLNNNRIYLGLGPMFTHRVSAPAINCELVSESYPRSQITYREIVPETQAEYPKTIDVVFSAFVSTGALAQFREPGKDYVFITEAGLWSRPDWTNSGDNGLLAGYRITPPDEKNWNMAMFDKNTGTYLDSPECEHNRELLRKNIIKVGINQVVQVIWKIQIGGIEQLGGIEKLYPVENRLKWIVWE